MLAVCGSLHISYIALVTDSETENLKFQSQFHNQVLRSGGLLSDGGHWQIASVITLKAEDLAADHSYLEHQLNQLEYTYTRFTYLKAAADVLSAIAQVSDGHGALGGLGEGRGWMTPKLVLDQVIADNAAAATRLKGWMTTVLTVDTTHPAVQGGGFTADSTGAEIAVASWNAVFAVARGIDSLFGQSIFPYKSDFSELLAETIQNSTSR